MKHYRNNIIFHFIGIILIILLEGPTLQGPFRTEMSSSAMSPWYPRPVMPSNTTYDIKNKNIQG